MGLKVLLQRLIQPGLPTTTGSTELGNDVRGEPYGYPLLGNLGFRAPYRAKPLKFLVCKLASIRVFGNTCINICLLLIRRQLENPA